MKKRIFVFLGIFSFFTTLLSSMNLLHEFNGGANDGSYPYGSLIVSGGTLYGMTHDGGDGGLGVIFKISTKGTGFALLHEFAGGANDGSHPAGGSLTLSGSTLYGATGNGGDSDKGTVFKIETNGTGFTLLHEFAGGADDGSSPNGSLILSGSTLYGMTVSGGDNNYGTIFKVETNGTGFALLHEFLGGVNDGRSPYDHLILSGSILYGMAVYGGDSDSGIIFKISTNGAGFTLLHEFAGGAADGRYPKGSLILSGNTLYGMTWVYDDGYGTIFKIGTTGADFTLLRKFVGGDDGKFPNMTSLILYGTMLYGMTQQGGENGLGTIFRIGTDGTDFSLLHEFSGGDNDGKEPFASLILSGSMLYGMTYGGGENNMGTIFSLPAVVVSDFNRDVVTDLVWRRYAGDGGNTVWLMSEATAGVAGGEGEKVEGAGYTEEGEENVESNIDGKNVGAEFVSALSSDKEAMALPEGAGMSTEYPVPEYPGPFGAISVMANVPLPALPDLTWKIVGSGDFNHDNNVDILWRYNGTGGSNAVWLMAGTNKTSSFAIAALADINWEIAGTGDFNNDKMVDILWRNKSNGKNMIWLMNGLVRSAIVNLPTQTNLTWKIVGCGDFNSDGKEDILWRFQGTGGGNQVWIMNGTARQSIVNIKAEANLNWKIAGVGDFDKNGKADIVWRNYATGGANRIWIMNNTAYVRTETLPAVADLKWKIEN